MTETEALRTEALTIAGRLLTEKLSHFERETLTQQFATLDAALRAATA